MKSIRFCLTFFLIFTFALSGCSSSYDTEPVAQMQETPDAYGTQADLTGEIYENETLDIRMVFPVEYTGKVTVIEFEDWFAVVHTATNVTLTQRYGGDYPFGTLFRVIRVPLNDEQSMQFHTQNGIGLFDDGNGNMVILGLPTDAQFDTENADSPETVEFLALSHRSLMEAIAASASRLNELLPTPVLTDAEVEAFFQMAKEAWSWFRMGPMPHDDTDTILDEDGHVYMRVDFDGVSSLHELEAYLSTIFTADIVYDFLDFRHPPVMYRNFDGVLHVLGASASADITRGDEHHFIIRVSDRKVVYQVMVYVYDSDTLTQVVGTHFYEYVLTFEGENWLFSDFPQQHAHEGVRHQFDFLGFSVEFPVFWEGKFGTYEFEVETEYGTRRFVQIYHLATRADLLEYFDHPGGTILTLGMSPREGYTYEYPPVMAGGTIFLAEAGGRTYFVNFPSGVEHMEDPAIPSAAEYLEMIGYWNPRHWDILVDSFMRN